MVINGLKCYGIKRGKTGVGIAVIRGKIFAAYTKNKIKAAPVVFNQRNLGEEVCGIIVNSGNANAYTGSKGIENARRMAEFLAKRLGCGIDKIAVASTGVIGRQLDLEEIESLAEEVFKNLGDDMKSLEAFAKSITTTDRFPKISVKEFNGVKIVGVAKGAGMIAPNMATMLAFAFTNAKVDGMKEIFREAVDLSFNRLVVDGDTSTNDTVFLVTTEEKEVERNLFRKKLLEVFLELAEMIAKDGEGATKVMWVDVRGALNDEDALKVAKSVASSLLVKTAIFGNDPNFGRIIAAIGYSSAQVDEEISLEIESGKGSAKIVEKGEVIGNFERAREIMDSDKIVIRIDLHKGGGRAYAIGCDLTHDYVELNSKYTT